jgi:hypothetical protein
MRAVSGVAAALVVAAGLGVLSYPALSDPSPRGDDQARILLFSSSDLWRHGGFSHGGVLWSQRGLDRDGPVLKLMFGGGLYYYRSGALGNIDVRGSELAGAVLPGWRFVRHGTYITVFAGYDFQSHRLSPDDPTAGLRGAYSGLRAGVELWHQPTPSIMIAADASVSTIGPGYSARLAAGWRLLDRFYFGPEVQAFAADDNYRQVRGGVHVTGLRFERFEWSAGFGWAGDSDDRGSLYGKLGMIARR